jgi:hypothetical protein
LNIKPEYDLSKMKSRKNPYSKEIEYTDEPIGDVKIIPDFLPSPAELTAKPKRDIYAEIVEGFDALEKLREGKITLRTFNVESKPVPKSSR